MEKNSVYKSERAGSLLAQIEEYVGQFQAIVSDPDNPIRDLDSDQLFTLFSDAFAIKMVWVRETEEEAVMVRELLGSIVDFLCVEIVRRHKERIL